MANLAKKFTGIAVVEIPADKVVALKKALDVLEGEGVMFYATAHIRLPKGLNAGELQSALEALAGSLLVDITLRKDG